MRISVANVGRRPVMLLHLVKLAADSHYWVAGGHLAFPAIGHLRGDAGRYIWIPANYTLLQ